MTHQVILPPARNLSDSTLALVIAVMREKFGRLSKADRDDLFELLPAIVMGDDDEQSSAIMTANEILSALPATVHSLDLTDESTSTIGNWLAFFSKKLKEARAESGLTQQQLAEKAGIPQSHVSRLENGQHSPSAKTIEKLATALAKPVSYFDPSAI